MDTVMSNPATVEMIHEQLSPVYKRVKGFFESKSRLERHLLSTKASPETKKEKQDMLTATRETRACKIERRIHVERTNIGVRCTITEEKQLRTKTTTSTTTYLLRRIESQLGGVGIEIEKLGTDGELYHVLLAGRHGHECDCAHGTYSKSGKPCRHIAAAIEARRMGLI
jgi:hypothetical protein